MKIYHNKLSAAEIRLDEVQKALEETTEELDIARSETQQWRVRADERQQSINGISTLYKSFLTEYSARKTNRSCKCWIKADSYCRAREIRNQRALSADKIFRHGAWVDTPKGRTPVELILSVKNKLTIFRAVKSQRDELESRSEHVMSDLRERLDHSEATNRSMQSYVNFLKTSYTSTFGDALDEWLTVPLNPTTVQSSAELGHPRYA